jgi:hypothetical protein
MHTSVGTITRLSMSSYRLPSNLDEPNVFGAHQFYSGRALTGARFSGGQAEKALQASPNTVASNCADILAFTNLTSLDHRIRARAKMSMHIVRDHLP